MQLLPPDFNHLSNNLQLGHRTVPFGFVWLHKKSKGNWFIASFPALSEAKILSPHGAFLFLPKRKQALSKDKIQEKQCFVNVISVINTTEMHYAHADPVTKS